MKKEIITLVVFFVLIGTRAFSQLEIKTNPVAILFEAFPISFEYVIQDHHGAEFLFVGAEGGGLFAGSYKYYFVPNEGGDRFYAGAFVGGISDYGVGFGFHAGYKLVAKSGILFDVGAGIGRGPDEVVIPMGQFSIGYRINMKKQ